MDGGDADARARECHDRDSRVRRAGLSGGVGQREGDRRAAWPTDAYVVNGFPIDDGFLAGLASRYTRVLTIEDGLIGTPDAGLQGFAGVVASSLINAGVSLHHFGIVDPSIAPSEAFVEVWEHFGISEKHLLDVLLEKP